MRDLLAMAFGVVAIVAGLGVAGWNLQTVAEGLKIAATGEPVTARIVAKRIERPHGRAASARVQSVSVNGAEIRSLRTYFHDHFLEVSIGEGTAARTGEAPVGFDRYRDEAVGAAITVTARPGSTFVDATPYATALYGLKRMGIGVLMALVGLVALRFRGTGSGGDGREGRDPLDPERIQRLIRERS